MIFIETPVFTEDLLNLLSDNEYKEMQKALLLEPEIGDLIQGSGGFRKMRWKQGSKGKRGGVRVIYYWEKSTQKLNTSNSTRLSGWCAGSFSQKDLIYARPRALCVWRVFRAVRTMFFIS